jgi:transcriptional regulator with XRE-family HTH domain
VGSAVPGWTGADRLIAGDTRSMTSSDPELARSLRQWRDRIGPAEVGLPANGRRRSTGLRREELAQLAGLSVDYITRLEQGRSTSPSEQVLGALARALRLTPDERDYLFRLAGQPVPNGGRIDRHLTPGVQRLLDRLADTPVAVFDAGWTLLAWNAPWTALMGDSSGLTAGRERNLPWQYFTGDPDRRVRHTPEQAERFEAEMAADLRAAAARFPQDAELSQLIVELRGGSPRFAELWQQGAVGVHVSERKLIRHPQVGLLTLDCDVLTVSGADLRIIAYTAEPGSTDAEKLALATVLGLQSMAT